MGGGGGKGILAPSSIIGGGRGSRGLLFLCLCNCEKHENSYISASFPRV